MNRSDREELDQFATWLLNIGNGDSCISTTTDDEGGMWIKIPADMLIKPIPSPFEAIFQAVYDDFLQSYANPSYLRRRAIITPFNETVDKLNASVLDILPGNERIYFSSDTIIEGSSPISQLNGTCPLELIHRTTLPGIADHELRLKVGAVVMLIRNISQIHGLCNGTRLLVTQLATNIIEARIITGEQLGDKVYIPRIIFPVKTNRLPFNFNRRQFPLKVSYAMTINKSQGQTLDLVGLYLPKPVFTHGQLYVALSRVTSRKGLKVLILNSDGKATDMARNVVYTEIFDNINHRINSQSTLDTN